MNRYELTYIIDTKLEEDARKELIEKFSGVIQQNGGEVEKVDETWGKRRLAYPINDMLEGYYVLVTFASEGDLPREVERNLEINENILRYLIIKLVEKKQSVKPRPVRAAAPVPPPPVDAPQGEDLGEAPKAEAPAVVADAQAPETEPLEAEDNPEAEEAAALKASAPEKVEVAQPAVAEDAPQAPAE